MRRRESVAWVLLGCAVMVCAFTFFWAEHSLSGIAASERKTQLEISDIMESRLYQNVSAAATVNPQFAGTGATASVNGNDAIGQINITTGANPKAGSLVHITFHTPYGVDGVQPIAAVSPLDQSPPPDWFYTIDWYGLDIVVGSAPKPHTNYPFTYIVAPRPWAMYLPAQK